MSSSLSGPFDALRGGDVDLACSSNILMRRSNSAFISQIQLLTLSISLMTTSFIWLTVEGKASRLAACGWRRTRICSALKPAIALSKSEPVHDRELNSNWSGVAA